MTNHLRYLSPSINRSSASPPVSTASECCIHTEIGSDDDGAKMLVGIHALAGRTLSYRLYVPPTSGHRNRLPLLVMLHGCGQDADDFANATRMNELAREEGVLVLYPEQAKRSNAHNCWNWFKRQHQQRGRGEPELIASLTQTVIVEHGADPTRVFVAGMSAGGTMAAILGHRYPDLFAAVGVHSAVPNGAARDLSTALDVMHFGTPTTQLAGLAQPLIVFHGDVDDVVHPANGAALASAACESQALRNPPEVLRGRSINGRSFMRTIYRHTSGANAVEHWQLCGAGTHGQVALRKPPTLRLVDRTQARR